MITISFRILSMNFITLQGVFQCVLWYCITIRFFFREITSHWRCKLPSKKLKNFNFFLSKYFSFSSTKESKEDKFIKYSNPLSHTQHTYKIVISLQILIKIKKNRKKASPTLSNKTNSFYVMFFFGNFIVLNIRTYNKQQKIWKMLLCRVVSRLIFPLWKAFCFFLRYEQRNQHKSIFRHWCWCCFVFIFVFFFFSQKACFLLMSEEWKRFHCFVCLHSHQVQVFQSTVDMIVTRLLLEPISDVFYAFIEWVWACEKVLLFWLLTCNKGHFT